MSETLERKIHFYQTSSNIPNDDGDAESVDIKLIFEKLQEISSREVDNFLPWGEDDLLGFWIESTKFPLKIKFGRIRVKNLPRKNSGLNLQELQLSPDEGLVELTHMIFYSNGIVGVEYNYHGPRPSAFRDYIWEKLGKRIYFHTLYNKNISDIFSEVAGIYEVKLKVSPSMLEKNTESGNDLLSGLLSINESNPSDMLEIKVKNYKNKKQTKNNFLGKGLLNVCKKITSKANARFGIEKLEISAMKNNGSKLTKNLLEDAFVFTKDIVKMTNSKAVDSEDMFQKLNASYNENEDVLLDSKILNYTNE